MCMDLSAFLYSKGSIVPSAFNLDEILSKCMEDRVCFIDRGPGGAVTTACEGWFGRRALTRVCCESMWSRSSAGRIWASIMSSPTGVEEWQPVATRAAAFTTFCNSLMDESDTFVDQTEGA